MSSFNRKKTLIMALYAGEIMLKNGAETYRVEDTIIRLCKSRNFHYVEVYVTPTGIFASADTKGDSQDEIVTYIKRIKSRGINLNKVAEVNSFSRQFVESDMPLDEALSKLKEIDSLKPYPKHVDALLGGGLSGAFFALLFGGNIHAFFGAFIAASIVSYLLSNLAQTEFPPFLSNIFGGATAAFMAIALSYISPLINVDIVITGAIMVMVPGVAITNAVRDSIAGDLVSGLARAAEAVIIATSIAVGVGFVLKLWQILLGGHLLWNI
ncbi:threonine/serine exporter family protein [Alkaliphilus oremlandii]|uniref:Threonine/serine exporter-like N-terminal domain-containing protein n=1 Tax=Alkaliphilus oremlandii (strain OhILAs) TaxID=350688 RepID=A8MGL8_ALKOO|nr:threonine/serine exporter family protein [Alkaliphilus oremlandii]ABW19241.1 protein of unknown function DUF1212 [Alkaliphilus oremlandii OhILAs]